MGVPSCILISESVLANALQRPRPESETMQLRHRSHDRAIPPSGRHSPWTVGHVHGRLLGHLDFANQLTIGDLDHVALVAHLASLPSSRCCCPNVLEAIASWLPKEGVAQKGEDGKAQAEKLPCMKICFNKYESSIFGFSILYFLNCWFFEILKS